MNGKTLDMFEATTNIAHGCSQMSQDAMDKEKTINDTDLSPFQIIARLIIKVPMIPLDLLFAVLDNHLTVANND